MSVYVTVGSTGFDRLIQTVSGKAFLQALSSQGFRRLVVQYGTSAHKFEPPTTRSDTHGISIESFDYTSRPSQLIEQADLIISHAGTGSILEALHSGTPIIIVVNRELMDDHQSEIAHELASSGYVAVAEPATLVDAVARNVYMGLVPYPAADPRPIGEIIDEETL
ncbi:N-acetylglucosaminyldiphosphodolichol N-acetylglucosaminyltransferase catalytic subunit alg13 [Coemansia sp. RSA 678]|nr:N-acetylglucosaminyldiphosphodolichol N-acetylglucosaminyltransferase catalytic subunit alg13 [Coemansia sp. RSA 678]